MAAREGEEEAEARFLVSPAWRLRTEGLGGVMSCHRGTAIFLDRASYMAARWTSIPLCMYVLPAV